jgi:iron complex outermembrane receptor protein
MKLTPTPIASAVALALMSAALTAHAQQQPTPAPTPPPATDQKTQEAQTQETVIITGIRGSLEQSLNAKRNADTNVEVVTAEDIGKMPDKNIADSLQRVPGVTISTASAAEGGFDENDRISMRGTHPSLTQTLFNGHPVGSGDWFVLNQVQTVGRSVSYSLLPSELVGQVVVHKGSRADILEGGVAGTVDILTRKPLRFDKAFTAEANVGAVYADLPDETDPQLSVLFNWRNDARNVGVMVQAFYEKRHLRRDGQEMLGYSTIAPTSAVALSNPDLAGVAFPNFIGSTLFEQTRERKGGLIDFQIKPTSSIEIDLTGFHSELEATNYNRNWLLWVNRALNGAGAGTATEQFPQAPTSYTVRNGTLVSGTWAPMLRADGSPAQYAIVDNIYRPGANSKTSFVDLDGKFRVTDRLTFDGRIGFSQGRGETPKQAVFEGDVFGTGLTYSLHGVSRPADAGVVAGNPASFTGTSLDWVFGASPAKTKDDETYGQLDAQFALDKSVFTTLKGGLRLSEHKRETQWTAQGPGPGAFANLPNWNGETYPSDFGSGLDGNFLRNVWQLSPSEIERWGDLYSNRDPVSRQFWPGEFKIKEENASAYIMTSLEGNRWSGNVGVRVVRTGERVTVNVACNAPCTRPDAIATSAFGPYYQQLVSHDYTDVLPSANLKLDLARDLVGRVGISRTMARPDYSALGGSIAAEDLNNTGNGGNPNLKPIRSNNADVTLEWYFMPRSLLAGGLFYMDLQNYVSFGNYQTTLFNVQDNQFETYTISAPVNSSGKVKGFELAYQQAFGAGFGALLNYTYANAKEDGPPNPGTGRNDLVGASRNTYNAVAYYEDNRFNVRVAYNYRSRFYNGLDRSTAQYQDDTANLSASLGFKFSKNLSVSLDALNLNNPTLKYYGNNRDQPTAFYSNGRQYYLVLRGKI